jgi:pyruvate carboxylase
VKCTVSGTTYEVARRKMLRALVEFRIRGVKVRQSKHPVLRLTTWLDKHPILVPPFDP